MGKGDKKTKRGKIFRKSYGKLRSRKSKRDRTRKILKSKKEKMDSVDSKEIEIWKPISFSENWLEADTSKLDDILPTWYRKRNTLQEGNSDYEEFLSRLKRQHAIETGVVEKLYDLSEGITQTFIKEGFVESYLQHGDTNISPRKLFAYLKDHFEAIDFIFDLVKNERPLSKSFIKQLHQLLTQNQETTEAIDQFGNNVQVKLISGKFKEFPNNPKRDDGSVFKYCPPVQVDVEIDKLLEIYNELVESEVHPVIISAWLHHAFTQIHPFQDGNGRVARLLASVILIKHGLFPLTIKREDKPRYIDALEAADNGNPKLLVEFFSELQKKSIEGVFNYKSKPTTSLLDAAKALSGKIDTLREQNEQERQQQLSDNRVAIFDMCYQLIGEIKNELFEVIPKDKAKIYVESVYPDKEKNYYYTKQIIEYANQHDYFFNRSLPRGWFKFQFKLGEDVEYSLIITLHHYSYDDSILAIGGFLEHKKRVQGQSGYEDETYSLMPIPIEPYTISLDATPDNLRKNIDAYLRDLVTVGVSQVANEIA
ncbi:30S ribosomal protein THX [Lewinella sp. LCG006]|uniref:30S ribosomal protein THX n=1 Tax=Lewinella sp. LCG006 TaxID=3231911 RepID=UPI003460F913